MNSIPDSTHWERLKQRLQALTADGFRSPAVLTMLGALLLGCLSLGARVFEHERNELGHESRPITIAEAQRQPGATDISARLTTVNLRAFDHVFVEVCSPHKGMPQGVEGALHVAMLRLEPPELMLRVPLDAAHVATASTSSTGACIQLGGGEIQQAGAYSIDAVFNGSELRKATAAIPLYARVMARMPLGGLDYAALVLSAFPILALLVLFLLRTPTPSALPETERGSAGPPGLTPFVALLALLALTQVPLFGATMGFIKGLSLAVMEAWLAAWLSAQSLQRLAFQRPARPFLATGLALLAGGLLTENARFWIRLVPSTGEAPIQTFISWPSGLLAFAGLGVLLPLSEELFFRGYLYQASARRLGTWGGALLSCSAFVALHVQQTYGQWGSLLAIAGTGITLTLLRVWTGSTLVPAITHVLYNLVLSIRSL